MRRGVSRLSRRVPPILPVGPSQPPNPPRGHRHRRRECPEDIGFPVRPAADRGRGMSSSRVARRRKHSVLRPVRGPVDVGIPCRGGRPGARPEPNSVTLKLERRPFGLGARPRSPVPQLRAAGTAGVRGSLADGQYSDRKRTRGQTLAATRVPSRTS